MISEATTAIAPNCAAQARDSMARHGIPDTPQNFWVWHAYHTGTNPDLSRAIDILLSNRREFTDQTNKEIFERFLGTAREHQIIQETAQRVEAALTALLRVINEARLGTTAYGETLGNLSHQLLEGHSLSGMLHKLMAETKTIEEQNQLLGQRLVTSSATIHELRMNLADVQRDATTDALTGIANRKLFDETLRQTAMQVMETGDDLSLLLIDIDHFKRFNDTWGHQTGDDVLKLVAKAIATSLRECDTPARYGGEEFTAILPKAGWDEAISIADRIRSSFESRKLVDRKTGKDIGSITVSIGVALFEPGEALSDFVNRADEGLYAAKNQGRNRVVAARHSDATRTAT